MTILVTGGTGLVGNNVVRALLAKGQRVRLLLRDPSDPRPLSGLDVETTLGDICDAESLTAACRGVAAVVHAAAMVHIGWTRYEQQYAVNVTGAQNVAQAARAAGARLVHVSSVDALGIGTANAPADEESPRGGKTPCGYVTTKIAAEEAIRTEISHGLDAVIVNPGFMLGPWDWKPSSGQMLLQVVKRFTPVAPRGGMSLCDVRDVAEGICAAIERGQSGRNYILGGHNMSYLEAWKLFARICGGHSPFGRAGVLGPALIGICGDLKTKLTGREGEVNSAAVKMSNLFHYYRSDRAAAELGYAIRPAEKTVADAWQWFREFGYV